MSEKAKIGGDIVTKIAGKEFKCSCGCRVLEEVMGDVTHSSTILSVDEETEVEYGKSSQDGGEVESIQCLECGKRYAGNYDELVENFKKNV